MAEIYMKWEPAFNLGIPEIDAQHRKIIDLINDLNKALVEDKTNQKIGKILDEMSEYAKVHFKTEERYFEESDFPLMKEHKAQHEYFINKIITLRENFDDNLSVTFRLMKFLRNWWTNHILDADREYVEIVKSKIN
ncbi:MAG: bacteriohemerythrin [Bacteroidales bacterium]|jgi:hemerythrin-like metal-binding protein